MSTPIPTSTTRTTVLRRALPLTLAAILFAVGFAGWALWFELRGDDPSDNGAVVDSKTTAQVQASVSQALGRVLTYDFQDPATTEAAADAVLAGKARKEYDTLFASLQQRAPGQQLTLTAQVQAIGVKQLHGDKAQLLVFLDQSSQRATDQESSVSAAQLSVTAEKKGSTWKITGLKPL
jgi:Mce-associated membrane protein